MGRYDRNFKTLTFEENERLGKCRVCVIGCGGLGGYIIEMLGRIGVGYITAVDKDVFEESNLNRQILSDVPSLGKSKAQKAKERMKDVNPLIVVNSIEDGFCSENAENILKGHDVIVDALDNVETRLLLQQKAEELRIPLVHGAIAGWYAQVTTVFPGDRTLDLIYRNKNLKGAEKELGNPSFTPALAASIQVSEVIKILIGRGDLLRKKLLFINLFEQEFEIIDLGTVTF
jgi:molybdopterin/thiamine biosynthesis adenylyltransferase